MVITRGLVFAVQSIGPLPASMVSHAKLARNFPDVCLCRQKYIEGKQTIYIWFTAFFRLTRYYMFELISYWCFRSGLYVPPADVRHPVPNSHLYTLGFTKFFMGTLTKSCQAEIATPIEMGWSKKWLFTKIAIHRNHTKTIEHSAEHTYWYTQHTRTD